MTFSMPGRSFSGDASHKSFRSSSIANAGKLLSITVVTRSTSCSRRRSCKLSTPTARYSIHTWTVHRPQASLQLASKPFFALPGAQNNYIQLRNAASVCCMLYLTVCFELPVSKLETVFKRKSTKKCCRKLSKYLP